MACHLVLDIGNVILAWRPESLIAECVPEVERRGAVLAATVGHPDWLALDRGTMEVEAAIARAQARVDVKPDWVASVYRRMPPSLAPVDDTIEAMREVHAAERSLYVLSNMPAHAAGYLRERHDWFRLCSGVVMSCDTGYVKPEAEIYRYLCATHGLAPDDCFFIDDAGANIDAARDFGMQGAVLERRDEGGRLIREWLHAGR